MREAARIQGFPDSHKFHGTRAEMLKQVGNAVPPPLGRALGEQIRAAVAGLRESAMPRDMETEELVAGSNKRIKLIKFNQWL